MLCLRKCQQCLFCTELNGNPITPSTCTKLIAATLTKFIHFAAPQTTTRSNYDNSHVVDETDYETLFTNSSYCKSCSAKSYEIVLLIEKLEKLQAELIKLQQGILDQLVHSLDDETSLSLQVKDAKERILLELQASIAKSNSSIKNSNDDACHTINNSFIPPSNTATYKDPSSAYVKLIQLNKEILHNYNNDNPIGQIKEEPEEFLIDPILDAEEFESSLAELPEPEQDPLFDDNHGINDDEARLLIKNGDSPENSQEFICAKFGDPTNSLQEQTAHFLQLHQIQSKVNCKSKSYFNQLSTRLITRIKRGRHKGLRGRGGWKNYYTCKYCQELKTRSPPELWSHIKTAHASVITAKQTTQHDTRSPVKSPKTLKEFQCTFCCKSYDLKPSLAAHLLRSHTKDVSIISSSSSSNEGSSPNPKRQHQPPGRRQKLRHGQSVIQTKFPCQYIGCGFIAQAKTRLQSHVKEVHVIEEPHNEDCIICPDCGLQLPSSVMEQQAAHAQLHANESIPTSYPCAHCPKTFMYASTQQEHFRLYHTELYLQSPEYLQAPNTMNKALLSMSSFECSYCTEVLPNPKTLWKHLKKQHKNLFKEDFKEDLSSGGMKSCSFCPKSFAGQGQLQKHFMTKHTVHVIRNNSSLLKYAKYTNIKPTESQQDSQSYNCHHEDCAASFTKKIQLTLHLKNHHAGPVSCSICSTSFKHKMALKHHQSKVHSTELNLPIHQCEVCGRSLCSANSLKVHIKLVHTREDLYSCPEPGCPFQGAQESVVAKHVQFVHAKCKDVLCTICGKTFFTNHRYKIHLRRHTGEKPFKCQICGKGFTAKKSLGRHEPLHGDERPFSCDLCGLKFPTRNNLYGHGRSHHKGKGVGVGVKPSRKSKYNDLVE